MYVNLIQVSTCRALKEKEKSCVTVWVRMFPQSVPSPQSDQTTDGTDPTKNAHQTRPATHGEIQDR